MKKVTLLTLITITLSMNACKDNSQEMDLLKSESQVLKSTISKLKQEQSVLEENKELVTNFYQEFFGDFNFESANKYIGESYIQHNPAVADGKDALVSAAKIWFQDAPKKTIKFNLVMAEKDLVFVQIIDERNGNRFSTMDVFRVTNGKISEHWDAFATLKKDAVSQNDNPLF